MISIDCFSTELTDVFLKYEHRLAVRHLLRRGYQNTAEFTIGIACAKLGYESCEITWILVKIVMGVHLRIRSIQPGPTYCEAFTRVF